MDEQRKHAILFAATILAARKLNELGTKPCPALGLVFPLPAVPAEKAPPP